MKTSSVVLVAFLSCLPASAQEKKPGFIVKENKPVVKDNPAIFTIDGKVNVDGKVRDFVVGEVFEFEKPNLQGKWNPNPVTAADTGWAYLVQRVWKETGELCIQPRLISSDGSVGLGRAFVVKYHPLVNDAKKRTVIGMEGKWRLAGTTRNDKTGGVFFVFEAVTPEKKK